MDPGAQQAENIFVLKLHQLPTFIHSISRFTMTFNWKVEIIHQQIGQSTPLETASDFLR